jgi:hypothetical protein
MLSKALRIGIFSQFIYKQELPTYTNGNYTYYLLEYLVVTHFADRVC